MDNQLNQQKTHRLAVLAFILSLLFFIPFAPCLGLILGVIARERIIKTSGLKGQSLAIGAITIGMIFGPASVISLKAIVPFDITKSLFLIATVISTFVGFGYILWVAWRRLPYDLKKERCVFPESVEKPKRDKKKNLS